jgi:hypothetical protein
MVLGICWDDWLVGVWGQSCVGWSIEANWGKSMTEFRFGLENNIWQAYYVINYCIPMDLSTHWEHVFFYDDVVYPIAHVCRGLQPPAMWTKRRNAPETIVGFARLWRIHAWRILEIENWSWINDTSKINQETSLTLGWEWHQSRHPDGIHYVRYLGWLLQGYSTFMMVLSVAFTFLGRAPIDVYWTISRWTVEYSDIFQVPHYWKVTMGYFELGTSYLINGHFKEPKLEVPTI